MLCQKWVKIVEKTEKVKVSGYLSSQSPPTDMVLDQFVAFGSAEIL